LEVSVKSSPSPAPAPTAKEEDRLDLESLDPLRRGLLCRDDSDIAVVADGAEAAGPDDKVCPDSDKIVIAPFPSSTAWRRPFLVVEDLEKEEEELGCRTAVVVVVVEKGICPVKEEFLAGGLGMESPRRRGVEEGGAVPPVPASPTDSWLGGCSGCSSGAVDAAITVEDSPNVSINVLSSSMESSSSVVAKVEESVVVTMDAVVVPTVVVVVLLPGRLLREGACGSIDDTCRLEALCVSNGFRRRS
jgi:hypothetical protein